MPFLLRLGRWSALFLVAALRFAAIRSYRWILSRTPALSPSGRGLLNACANARSIDTQALVWVTHQRTDPRA